MGRMPSMPFRSPRIFFGIECKEIGDCKKRKTELVDNSVSGQFNKGPKTSGDGGNGLR